MQTSTQRPAKARKPVAAKLQYPEKSPTPKFDWLVWYFRDCAQAEALTQAYHKALNLPDWDSVLAHALNKGALQLKKEAAQSLKYAIEEGLLPFAWQGTTVFELAGVPA